jgi:hypothetical protein
MIMSRIFSSAEPDPQLTWTAMAQLIFFFFNYHDLLVEITGPRFIFVKNMMGIHLTQVTTIGSVATHGRGGGGLSPDSCGTRISV